MSTQTLTVDLVLSGGSIDQAASEQAFRTALSRRIAELETEQGQIADATAELFDQYRGQAIPMPTVGSMVAQKLNAQPENHAVLSERVKGYVRANSQETKDAAGNVTQHPDSLFVIGKGKNGGVSRRADRPAKA
jgi:hypothetical protein